MSQAHQPSGQIDIHPSYFFLAFLLSLFKPKASINGSAPFDIKWGSNPIPVAPGRYQVEVWLPYLFLPQMGKNGMTVDVPDGGAVKVTWRAPWLVFLQGKITAQGPVDLSSGVQAGMGSGAPSPALAAQASAPVGGWFPDPSGRYESRYYDGTAWTEHVARAGVQSTDPIGS
ncbi:MAG: DUF2510 domain-containing protein [Acidimicrobiales bacterium]|nr:DUF2510 domain-containing protein [Acidimicrobiales bacterium]